MSDRDIGHILRNAIKSDFDEVCQNTNTKPIELFGMCYGYKTYDFEKIDVILDYLDIKKVKRGYLRDWYNNALELEVKQPELEDRQAQVRTHRMFHKRIGGMLVR